jgi:hypothetical protein
MVMDAGANEHNTTAELFILKWDAAHSAFITRRLVYALNSGQLEHITFAPINLPSQ